MLLLHVDYKNEPLMQHSQQHFRELSMQASIEQAPLLQLKQQQD